MDCVGNYLISRKSEKKVNAKTSGKEKVRSSCLLNEAANGTKQLILCVVPRKRQIPGLDQRKDIIYVYETNGTFDSKILVEHYVDRILRPYFLQHKLDNGLIILDQARCHLQESFKSALKRNNLEFVYIPPSMTVILQPADVEWFKPLKNKYKVNWNNWFLGKSVQYCLP